MRKWSLFLLLILGLILLSAPAWGLAADVPIPNLQHQREPVLLLDQEDEPGEDEQYFISPLAGAYTDDTPGRLLLSLLLMGILISVAAVSAVVMIYRAISRDHAEDEKKQDEA